MQARNQKEAGTVIGCDKACRSERSLNPWLAITTRTKRLEDTPALTRAGATHVVAEEMLTAGEIIVLTPFVVSRVTTFEQVHKIRAQTIP